MTEENRQRYLKAVHAMQSGVAMKKGLMHGETDTKHLRVGVNSAMCDHAALVRLLMEKGILTKEEYTKAVADEMEREVERYKKELKELLGAEVNLA